MTLAAASRAGTAALFVSVPASIAIALGFRSVTRWIALTAVMLVLFGFVLWLYPSTSSLALREGFLGQDLRYEIWPDVIFTTGVYWPIGSGFGTFVPVFAANESLDLVQSRFVNHAHNDSLEWLLEAGLLGALWFIAFAGIITYKVLRSSISHENRGSGRRALALGSLLILAVVAFLSTSDYPLRTDAVLILAACAVGIIFNPLRSLAAGAYGQGKPSRWQLLAAVALSTMIALQVVRMRTAEWALRNGDPTLAYSMRSQNARAAALEGQRALLAKDYAAVRRHSIQAISSAPLTPSAVRNLALVESIAQRNGGAAWQIAAAMGWRDGPTQLLAFRQAFANSETIIAAMRADAFMRSNPQSAGEEVRVVRAAAAEPRFRAALADRLKRNPDWRRTFFNLPENAPQSELAGLLQALSSLNKIDRADVRGAIGALIKNGRYDEADRLYRRSVEQPSTRAALLDAGFERTAEEYQRNNTRLDWNFIQSGTDRAYLDKSSGDLIIETDGESSRTLVERLVVLNPGTYQTSLVAAGQGASEGFLFSAGCVAGSAPVKFLRVLASAPVRGERTQRFEIPAGCPLVRLAISTVPIGQRTEIRVQQVVLSRVR